jgi:two-component system, OmpR family, response regulator
MRILVIEDDQRLAKLIARVLRDEHYAVDVLHDGDEGLMRLLDSQYELAIIDWMLPGRDGPAICRAVRAARLPVALLLLTARGQLEDRVMGLDNGADDYLIKPFAFEELLARIRALSRRFNPAGSSGEELRVGELVMDLRTHQTRRGDQLLDLTATEWNLLELFLRHPNQVLGRQQIFDYVWPLERDVQPNVVNVYMSYLRRKLGSPDPFMTIHGVGYRLDPERA